MHKYQEILKNYEHISLSETKKVTLQNRIDTKFLLHNNLLPELLKSISKDYFIVKNNNCFWQKYETIYFDTPNLKFYHLHNNGKLNRYKIRMRRYLLSHENFLEFKFKSNKNRTIKNRIPLDFEQKEITNRELTFLSEKTKNLPFHLRTSLTNQFDRITLIHKNYTERITIDTNLLIKDENNTASLNNLVVAEIKCERKIANSNFYKLLKKNRIYPTGFSKYVMGNIILHPELKHNRFKNRLKKIELLKNSN